MKFNITKIVILLIVIITLAVACYFGYKAIFSGEQLSFHFDPAKGYNSVAYTPISVSGTDQPEEGVA